MIKGITKKPSITSQLPFVLILINALYNDGIIKSNIRLTPAITAAPLNGSDGCINCLNPVISSLPLNTSACNRCKGMQANIKETPMLFCTGVERFDNSMKPVTIKIKFINGPAKAIMASA